MSYLGEKEKNIPFVLGIFFPINKLKCLTLTIDFQAHPIQQIHPNGILYFSGILPILPLIIVHVSFIN